ncbi:MAG: hypothetical protein L0Y74_05755 [candidate division Zixibacteria bacterium]|nr:hypothetical protein [candidate division Zixibacteria bacterium]
MKKLLFFALSVTFLVAVWTFAHGQGNLSQAEQQDADTEQIESVESAMQTFKKHSLSGFVNSEIFEMPDKADPVEMAYRFFELNRGKYHMTNPREELVLKRQFQDEYGAMVSFGQLHNGVLLLDSDIRAHYNRHGNLMRVQGDYFYDMNLPTTPGIDSATAVGIALQDLGSPSNPKVGGPHGAIIASSNMYHPFTTEGLHLVYVVEIIPDREKSHPKFWRFYINALDGSILLKHQESTWIE